MLLSLLILLFLHKGLLLLQRLYVVECTHTRLALELPVSATAQCCGVFFSCRDEESKRHSTLYTCASEVSSLGKETSFLDALCHLYRSQADIQESGNQEEVWPFFLKLQNFWWSE